MVAKFIFLSVLIVTLLSSYTRAQIQLLCANGADYWCLSEQNARECGVQGTVTSNYCANYLDQQRRATECGKRGIKYWCKNRSRCGVTSSECHRWLSESSRTPTDRPYEYPIPYSRPYPVPYPAATTYQLPYPVPQVYPYAYPQAYPQTYPQAYRYPVVEPHPTQRVVYAPVPVRVVVSRHHSAPDKPRKPRRPVPHSQRRTTSSK